MKSKMMCNTKFNHCMLGHCKLIYIRWFWVKASLPISDLWEFHKVIDFQFAFTARFLTVTGKEMSSVTFSNLAPWFGNEGGGTH